MGFQTEHFYKGTGIFLKVQTGLYDFRIVEDHQFSGREEAGQIRESIFRNLSVPINEQFGRVTLAFGIFGNTFIGEFVRVVLDLYVFCLGHRVYVCTRKDTQKFPTKPYGRSQIGNRKRKGMRNLFHEQPPPTTDFFRYFP